MIATALEDATTRLVGWLPAHLTANELGVTKKSDGSLVLPEEIEANNLADQLAKRGDEFHRVAKSDVDAWAWPRLLFGRLTAVRQVGRLGLSVLVHFESRLSTVLASPPEQTNTPCTHGVPVKPNSSLLGGLGI